MQKKGSSPKELDALYAPGDMFVSKERLFETRNGKQKAINGEHIEILVLIFREGGAVWYELVHVTSNPKLDFSDWKQSFRLEDEWVGKPEFKKFNGDKWAYVNRVLLAVEADFKERRLVKMGRMPRANLSRLLDLRNEFRSKSNGVIRLKFEEP